MAWIVCDLDQTLIADEMPVEGAVEACTQLVAEGNRLTVFTSRFAPMPDTARQRLKEQIEQELAAFGFPPMEVWTGTTKPDADIFIGHNFVTYDGDWNLCLAQTEAMLSEMGIQPIQPMDPAQGQEDEQRTDDSNDESEPQAIR